MMYPRALVPAGVGAEVRRLRNDRRWSQERLASKAGVSRRTIVRLEAGLHLPSSRLVHALERALDLSARGLVAAWKDGPDPDMPSLGPRARLARRAMGLTLPRPPTRQALASRPCPASSASSATRR